MHATAWNNGSHDMSGAGYGLRISKEDRDRHFNPACTLVIFNLGGEEDVEVRLSKSFWRSCTELRSSAIGRWLRRNGLAPWPKGNPPTFAMRKVGRNGFAVALPGHTSQPPRLEAGHEQEGYCAAG